MIKNSLIFFTLLYLLCSCGINSNLMFKETKDGKVVVNDSIPLTPSEEYKISPNDKFTFTISTKDGRQLIDQQTGASKSDVIRAQVQSFLVKADGNVELPIIGDIKLADLTISECENLLEEKYSSSYQNPFVKINVTNKRVIVFTGDGSDAKVVILTNENTTLMEALALAGGITDRGKANAIKLMRKIDDHREVYTIDLSTLDGLIYADMVVQANDYIYVEPTAQISRELLAEVTPIVSILSAAIVIITVLTNNK